MRTRVSKLYILRLPTDRPTVLSLPSSGREREREREGGRGGEVERESESDFPPFERRFSAR